MSSAELLPATTPEAELSWKGQPRGRRGPRFSLAHRARRCVQRWGNELGAIAAERRKSSAPRAWPVLVNLNHTTICNLRCVMCEQALYDIPQVVMPPHVYRRVREELFERISEISLTVMGDPFCVPGGFFDEILDDVERYGLRLEITTNATLFGNDEELARLLRAVDKLVISVDGATRETFERIRVPARWDRVVGNIERARDLRRRMPLHRRPLVYFSYVAMRSNVAELPAFVDLARAWDGYAVSVSPLVVVHESLRDEALDPADPEVRRHLEEARDRARRNGLGLRVSGVDLGRSRARPAGLRNALRQATIPVRPVFTQGLNYLAQKVAQRFRVAPRECGFLWSKAYVQVDGKVSTCCHPKYYVTGNLQHQSFADIWNGSRYRGLRAALNSPFPARSCRECHLLR